MASSRAVRASWKLRPATSASQSGLPAAAISSAASSSPAGVLVPSLTRPEGLLRPPRLLPLRRLAGLSGMGRDRVGA